MTPGQVEALRSDQVAYLWQSITIIEAQNFLVDLQKISYPYLKKDQQKKLHKSMHKNAYPGTWSNDAPVETRDFAKLLGVKSV